ncbi:Acid sphingomyelinase-like phosphodiesterase 3b [Galdieria sulphuraria]|nr:Acid sphingomyelinase-like phosphodiesterase 3b [Galdieria sulphuraria]
MRWTRWNREVEQHLIVHHSQRLWSLESLLFWLLVVIVLSWVGVVVTRQLSYPILSRFKKSRNLEGFFHISDIHMDPLYQPTWSLEQGWSCRRPSLHLSVSDQHNLRPVWETIHNSSELAYPFGRLGCDSSIFLVESMLQAMKKVCSFPAFILFTGDLVAHEVPHKLHKETILRWLDLYRYYFPNTCWIPVVGNHDIFIPYSDDDDRFRNIDDMERYVIQQLSQLEQLYFQNTSYSFQTLGCHSYHMMNDELRVIVYNSLWFTPRFWSSGLLSIGRNDSSERVGIDDEICESMSSLYSVQQQQIWLRKELFNAIGKKVILVSHIPPGWKSSEEYNWCPVFVDWFVSLMREYSIRKDMLSIQLYGDHTNDELRVMTQKDHSLQVISTLLIHSGLSSRRRVPGNPSFRWVDIENQQSHSPIRDYTVYIFPLQRINWEWKWKSMGRSDPFSSMSMIPWKLLYRWSELYKVSTIDAKNMADWIEKLSKDFDTLENYVWAQTIVGSLVAFFGCTIMLQYGNTLLKR